MTKRGGSWRGSDVEGGGGWGLYGREQEARHCYIYLEVAKPFALWEFEDERGEGTKMGLVDGCA